MKYLIWVFFCWFFLVIFWVVVVVLLIMFVVVIIWLFVIIKYLFKGFIWVSDNWNKVVWFDDFSRFSVFVEGGVCVVIYVYFYNVELSERDFLFIWINYVGLVFVISFFWKLGVSILLFFWFLMGFVLFLLFVIRVFFKVICFIWIYVRFVSDKVFKDRLGV